MLLIIWKYFEIIWKLPVFIGVSIPTRQEVFGGLYRCVLERKSLLDAAKVQWIDMINDISFQNTLRRPKNLKMRVFSGLVLC